MNEDIEYLQREHPGLLEDLMLFLEIEARARYQLENGSPRDVGHCAKVLREFREKWQAAMDGHEQGGPADYPAPAWFDKRRKIFREAIDRLPPVPLAN